MGKRIIAQRRGSGSAVYRAPGHRYKGATKLPSVSDSEIKGIVRDLIRCPAHSAPLAFIEYNTGQFTLVGATEGLRVGEEVIYSASAPLNPGNTLPLENIPEGIPIFNIEGTPGDGGKYVRSSGTSARIISKSKNKIIVMLPSKKQKTFNPNCRANLGVVAGGGRTEKPIMKAGIKYYKMKAKNKLWPKTSGGAMNAVDHPFGNKRSSRKSKAKPAPHNAPPGRKVGAIRPRRTGRKK